MRHESRLVGDTEVGTKDSPSPPALTTNPVSISERYDASDNNCTAAGYTFEGTAKISPSTLVLIP
jgi:hypothetical protein